MTIVYNTHWRARRGVHGRDFPKSWIPPEAVKFLDFIVCSEKRNVCNEITPNSLLIGKGGVCVSVWERERTHNIWNEISPPCSLRLPEGSHSSGYTPPVDEVQIFRRRINACNVLFRYHFTVTTWQEHLQRAELGFANWEKDTLPKRVSTRSARVMDLGLSVSRDPSLIVC